MREKSFKENYEPEDCQCHFSLFVVVEPYNCKKMDGGKNRRGFSIKMKVFFVLLALGLFLTYIRSRSKTFSKEQVSKLNNFKTAKDSVGRKFSDISPDRGSRTSWDRNPHSKENKLGTYVGDKPAKKYEVFERKESFRKPPSKVLEDNKWTDEESDEKEEDTEWKMKTDNFKKVSNITKASNKATEVNKLTNENIGKLNVSGNSSTKTKKITFKRIASIAREILDRLNISSINATWFKFNETKKLSTTAVGNISKELMRQNLSQTIARAVIMVLAQGDGSGRNVTLGKKLWKDFKNNPQQSNLNQNNDRSRGQNYVDKYQQANGIHSQKNLQGYPTQRQNDQRYGGDHSQPMNREDQPKYTDNQQYNRQPSRYDNTGQSLQYQVQHKQHPYRDERQQPRYRENAEQPRYRDEHQPSRIRDDRKPSRLRDEHQPSRLGDEYQLRLRDEHKPSKLKDEYQPSRNRDEHEPLVHRNEQEPFHTDEREPRQYRDNQLPKYRDEKNLQRYENVRNTKMQDKKPRYSNDRVMPRYQANRETRDSPKSVADGKKPLSKDQTHMIYRTSMGGNGRSNTTGMFPKTRPAGIAQDKNNTMVKTSTDSLIKKPSD